MREATATLNLTDHQTLHPASMYHLLARCPRGFHRAGEILDQGDFSRFPARHARPSGLPFEGDYLVAKFYANTPFPHTDQNQAFIDGTLRRLAERLPVVVLNTGLTLDAHREFATPDAPGIYEARTLVQARDNLGVQAALVANSRGFVGTYGGFSYLAPLLGVPALGVYSESQFVPANLASAAIALTSTKAAVGYSVTHTSGCTRMVERARP